MPASYVAGACVGALFFGWLTDRFGRKRLFMVTLGYLAATALTGLSTEAWMFFLFRGLSGLGIGGEYAAINSAIDQLIPKERRGRIDLIINGTFWLGVGFVVVARTVFGRYPSRATLGIALFIGQAFLSNAITFGFGSILGTFFGVPTDRTGYFHAVIAVGNLLGRSRWVGSSTSSGANR